MDSLYTTNLAQQPSQKYSCKGAYPIAQAALNFIPGVGTLVMGADFILDMFGLSPVRWLVNNLVDLVPDKAFKSLGKFALGKPKKVNDGIINPR